MKTSIVQLNGNKWNQPLPNDMDSNKTWVLILASPKMAKHPAVEEVLKAFPKSVISGCSSSGEIFSDRVYDESLSVSVCRFDKTNLKQASVDLANFKDSTSAGAALGKELKAADLQAVFVLSDGLNVNGTELTRGMNQVLLDLPRPVTISGGLAGDGADFKNTFTIEGSGVHSKKILAIGFYGKDLVVGTGSVGGWDPFGPQRKVTKSEGNVLHHIDGKPALDLYKEYLGDQAKGLPGSALLYPLSITHNERKDIVRTVLAVDETTKTMTFAGDIPEGATIQLMKANFSRLVAGAESAGVFAKKNSLENHTTLAVAVSCVGRRLVLGERIDDETEAVLKILPKDTKMVGFYSYGELSPAGKQGCELHNQTMTLTLLQEK
jgi:hypothetical protein